MLLGVSETAGFPCESVQVPKPCSQKGAPCCDVLRARE